MKYQVGDVVQVKPGTVSPDDPNLDFSGWQGRVTDLTWVDEEKSIIGFA